MTNHDSAPVNPSAPVSSITGAESLTHADHARPGERLYMSAEWGTDPCEHCAAPWLPTRWDVSRHWICKFCDETKDRYQGGNRRSRP